MTRRFLRRVVQPTSDRRSDVSDMRYDLSHRLHSIFIVSVVLRGAGHSQDAAMSPFAVENVRSGGRERILWPAVRAPWLSGTTANITRRNAMITYTVAKGGDYQADPRLRAQSPQMVFSQLFALWAKLRPSSG
jgi:hypothetical protein